MSVGDALAAARLGTADLSQLVVSLSGFPKIKDIGDPSGYASVYLASDPRNGGQVAVKVLRREMLMGDDSILFQREVELMASLDHPTLLRLRGFVPMDSPNGDPPAIVTDYMERGSLRQVIRIERGRAPPPEWDPVQKLIVLYGVSVGMLTLHRRQVIHRDLKPANVLLDSHWEPKICDFGLSKLVDPETKMQQTRHEGTIAFMSPERHRGEDYGFPDDVYAFGVLAYSVVTGLTPFENAGFPMEAIGFRVAAGVRPKIPDGLGAKWTRLIENCWDQNPRLRPTFEEIARQLGGPAFAEMFDMRSNARFCEYRRRVDPPDLRSPAPPTRPAPPRPPCTEPTIKVLVLGASAVGKTCIFCRFLGEDFIQIPDATIGPQSDDLHQPGISLQIWDTPGQEIFRSIVVTYFRVAHVMLLVYDVTHPSSFESVKYFASMVRDRVSGSPAMFVVRNKIDLDDWRVSFEEGMELAAQLDAKHWAVSAKTGEGIDELLDAVSEAGREIAAREAEDPVAVRLDERGGKEKKDCC
jgi:small GTP-binding protein